MEFNSKKAIYYQISDLICENILLNRYQEEQRIDSVREMAINVEVNPNTVMRAYSFLQEEGIIFNKRGIGYFISKGAKQIVLTLKKSAFITDELPAFFKESSLYGFKPNEIAEYYNKYLEGVNNENK